MCRYNRYYRPTMSEGVLWGLLACWIYGKENPEPEITREQEKKNEAILWKVLKIVWIVNFVVMSLFGILSCIIN